MRERKLHLTITKTKLSWRALSSVGAAVNGSLAKREPIIFLDLSALKLKNSQKNLTTFGEDRVVGVQKELLWERLLFLLSLRGNVPLSTLCHHLRRSSNSFVCSNEYSKIAEIAFKECYYFGDNNCTGIRTKELANESYLCYDWIAFNRGGKHDIDLIETGDDFVSQIWFYSSDRIDGKTKVKDACLVSRLNEESLTNFDYSETMARFKAVSEMEKRGMKNIKVKFFD